jgi:hypothetical protein
MLSWYVVLRELEPQVNVTSVKPMIRMMMQ